MAIGKSGYGAAVGGGASPAAATGERSTGSGSGSGEDSMSGSGDAFPLGLSGLVARMEKVAEIGAAVAAGTYRVSAWEVAEKFYAIEWAQANGHGSIGNQSGGADSLPGGRIGFMASETDDFREPFAPMPEEEARWEGEWSRLSECGDRRVDRAGRRKLCDLIDLWRICSAGKDMGAPSLLPSRRQRRSSPDVQ